MIFSKCKIILLYLIRVHLIVLKFVFLVYSVQNFINDANYFLLGAISPDTRFFDT